MQIILVRIPQGTTHRDIADFLETALKGSLFVRKGIIEKIEIQILYDDRAQITEYHGLVRIEPDAAARRVIKKLNRKAIKGKHIAVREYHIRNSDPRLRLHSPKSTFSDRREADRRRSHLQILSADNDAVRFTGNKSFHRNY